MSSIKVVHLTSAHPRYDSRIFHRMCRTLAQRYDVTLVVADGKGDEECNGVRIRDVDAPTSRKERLLVTTRRVLQKALELDAHIYHLHDPELIFAGLQLKKAGKKVIFDAHEDLPKQMLSKHYLHPFVRRAAAGIYERVERLALRRFDYIVAATPRIREKFTKMGMRCVDIDNFPRKEEFADIEPDYSGNRICYIGSLYPTRGIGELVEALEDLDVELVVAGKFHDREYEERVRSLPGWKKVDFRGYVGLEEIRKILAESFAGAVTLHPTPAYVEAYPVKLFEYMLAGLPVIASRFYQGLYKDGGIGVDPKDVDAIKRAILALREGHRAAELGARARGLALRHYCWEMEELKLFGVYDAVARDLL